MTAHPENRTDSSFWAGYWSARRAVRVIDERYFYADLLDEVLAGREGSTLIELGGFPGHFGVYAHRRFGCVPTLLDRFVDRAVVEKLLAANGLPASALEAIEADVFTYETDRRWDIVLSAGFIEHFDDLDAVVAAHLRFLRPGGLLLLTVPNFLGVNGWLQRRFDPEVLAVHNLRVMDPAVLAAVLERQGLRSVDVRYYGKFRVWLEDIGARPLRVRLLVYGIRAAGALLVDPLRIRSRLTSRDVVATAVHP